MTRITWLLPIRNGMPYLTETLAAIAGQTHRDWQMLAWDNGSTDDTLEELRRWIPARIPGKIVSDRPLPLGICLATMVTECETELCARIDADDVCLPERLERQTAFLDAHPEVAAVGTATEKIDSEGVIHGLYHTPPSDHFGILCYMIHSNPIAHPSVLFRRNAILEAGNYSNVKVEDYELWQRVAQRYRLANLSEPLLRYRVHSKSLVGKFVEEGQYQRTVASDCASSASALYGATISDMRLLRERKHRFALRPLKQIARTLSALPESGAQGEIRNATFLDAAYQVLWAGDLLTKFALLAADPRIGTRRGITHIAGRFFSLLKSASRRGEGSFAQRPDRR